jgi:hypothetical protein
LIDEVVAAVRAVFVVVTHDDNAISTKRPMIL